MILKEKGADVEYVLDTKKLRDIEFPFYTPYNRSAYYLPADKSVYLPLRFRFVAGSTGHTAGLQASIRLPAGGEIKASAGAPYEDILSAMVAAYDTHSSLFDQPIIARRMEAVAKACYQGLDRSTEDFVLNEKVYENPSFLFLRGRLIGAAEQTLFKSRNDQLTLTMKGTQGTFLRAFRTEEDNRVTIIVLSRDGSHPVMAGNAVLQHVRGNDVSAVKERNAMPPQAVVNQCLGIYRKYKENYMNYFLDQEEKEEGSDLFEPEGLFRAL